MTVDQGRQILGGQVEGRTTSTSGEIQIFVRHYSRELCWGERLVSSLGLEANPAHCLGFVDGKNTLAAPPYSGRLAERPAERGDRVVKGARLFVIETTQAEAEVNRAKATLAEARHRTC